MVIPFFIPHSDHTELAIKLVTHRKAPPPMDWAVVEEKSLSLREPESRKLLSALSAHLLVAESGETGDFLLIRVAEGTAQLGTHDPAKVAAPLTKVLSEDEILQHLQGAELSTELASAFRGAIRLNEMRSAVAQLRSQGWSESKLRALHGLNRRLSGVMVMTYDHLLAQGERLVEMLSPKSEPIADIEAPPAAPLDDDIPF